MRLKILTVLVALAPTLAMAQSSLPAVSTTGKSAGMPPDPTPQAIQNTVKAVETVSGAASMSHSNPVPPTSSTCSSGKNGGSTMKSSEKSSGKETESFCHYTSAGFLQCCDG